MSNRVASGHAEKCTLSKALLIFLGDFLAIFVCRLHIGVPLFFCHLLVRKSILIVQLARFFTSMLTSPQGFMKNENSQQIKIIYLIKVNLCQKLLFLQNMGRTCCVQKIVLNVKNNFCAQHVFPRFELGIFM